MHVKLLLLLVSFLAAHAVFSASTRADTVGIIPLPSQMKIGVGSFRITASTQLIPESHNQAAADAANAVARRFSSGAGFQLVTVEGNSAPNGSILITTHGADASLGEEGYALDVTTNSVTIRAPHSAGLFYGVQTLLQLLPAEIYAQAPDANSHFIWSVPVVQIKDQPTFRWRGMLLDVARHFEPQAEVLRLLDQMAMHKLNVLHLHLTDDQGWRLEIKQYPKLTSIGAWRERAAFGLDPKLSTTYRADGQYGGFYTQDQARELVSYAAARHIQVMPEIEMPGHASAALRAYPEYFVPGPPSTQTKGDAGVFNGIYEPASEKTFTFLQNVLTEVMDLFPSAYIHIGGDEVPKEPWQANPLDVAFMSQKHLANTDQLQSYFISRIGKFLESKGRKMVGWDEILEGGLAPHAVVMSWRGIEGGQAAANAGHDVIMTPGNFCYLDGEQAHGTEPHERGNLLPVEKVYSYEPVPPGLPKNLVNHILGLQGNLWTEYVPNMPWAEYMTWPREAAIAEVGWTPAAQRNWSSFSSRLMVEQQRLDAMGVNYRPMQDDQLTRAIHLDTEEPAKLVIDNPVTGTEVHYSMDANFPTKESPLYSQPLAVPSGYVQVTARFFRPGVVATTAASATFLDGRAVTITSTIPNDWDQRQKSFFTPSWGVGPGDSITILFADGPQMLNSLTVKTGQESKPNARLKSGLLAISTDGKVFKQAAEFGADGSANASLHNQPIRAIRIRITAPQMSRPIIRSVVLR